MRYFIDGNDGFYALENDATGVREGWVQITEVEAAPYLPTPPSPSALIISQIDAMERVQLMPRATREFMLLFMQSSFTAEQLAANPGYSAVKAFDDQIVALRSQL